MTLEALQMCSIVCYILAGFALVLAIAMFFIFDIIKVIGAITGIKAKKDIQRIKELNALTGDNRYVMPDVINPERDDPVNPEVITPEIDKPIISNVTTTEELEIDNNISETTILNPETTILNSEMLNTDKGKNNNISETTILKPEMLNNEFEFKVIVDISFIASEEIIK